jgi:hypothetical protein
MRVGRGAEAKYEMKGTLTQGPSELANPRSLEDETIRRAFDGSYSRMVEGTEIFRLTRPVNRVHVNGGRLWSLYREIRLTNAKRTCTGVSKDSETGVRVRPTPAI